MTRKRVAAIVTEYRENSHADVIVTKLLEGYRLYGVETEPRIEVASLYLDLVPGNDIGLAMAEKHGVLRAQIALAWLLQKEPVTAPIIGATKISHLDDAAGALAVKLSAEEVAYLEEPYVPHRVIGHQ